MLDNLKKKGILRGVGIVLVGGLVILFWWLGWFYIVFYILGLYGAVYVVSYLFKTTAIINFLLGIGVVVLYAISTVVGLYLLYLVLQIMFTGRFLFGSLLLFSLGIFSALFYFIPMAIGLVLGYPLIFMSEDIEKRFHTENNNHEEETKPLQEYKEPEEIEPSFENMRKARIDKVLNTNIRVEGEIKTKKQFIEDLINQGFETETEEKINEKAQERAKKTITDIQMEGEQNIRADELKEAKEIVENPPKIKTYQIINKSQNSIYSISKIEYDYAQSLEKLLLVEPVETEEEAIALLNKETQELLNDYQAVKFIEPAVEPVKEIE